MTDFFSSIWCGPWFDAIDLPAQEHQPTRSQLSWLMESGSLTARLKAQPGAFSLELIQQCHTQFPQHAMMPWSAEHGVVREISMSLDGLPQVFAQSFLPQSTIEAFAPLATLGQMPLGEYIFQQPALTKHWLQFAWFEMLSLTPNLTVQQVWARRSLYALQGHQFLVQEVFLKEMPT